MLDPRPRILVVCEGTTTEPEYFRHFIRHHRVVSARVVIDDEGGVPRTLVERATRAKKQAERAGKGKAGLAFDQVWCVFDVDEHPNMAEAIDQARANGVELAISNPCFELWLVLHFKEHTKHVHRHILQRDCRTLMPGHGKSPRCDQLICRHEQAVARARQLDAWQRSRESVGANPSTAVHHLTETLRAYGKSELLKALSAANAKGRASRR